MNTSTSTLEKRQRSKSVLFSLTAIYKQLKQLERHVSGEEFDELAVKKDYEQPRCT